MSKFEMKRARDGCLNAGQKRVRFSDDTVQEATFTSDSVPENHFPLGGDNYAIVSDFANVMRIHLRYFKTDSSGCLRPTKRGISLTPDLWQTLFSRMDSTELLVDSNFMEVIGDGLLMCTERINEVPCISLQRFFQKMDFSRKFVNHVCILTHAEWNELKKIRKEVSSAAVRLMFGAAFKRHLLREVQSRVPPTSFPESNNADMDVVLSTSMVELLKDHLTSNIDRIFKCNGCEMGWENQLGHECITSNNELRASVYSDRALLLIDLSDFVKDYVERNKQISNYVNECFVDSLNMCNVIKAAIDLYIASDSMPLRMF